MRDAVSRDLCSEIQENEEEYVDWLETQLGRLGKVGIQSYQQTQFVDDD